MSDRVPVPGKRYAVRVTGAHITGGERRNGEACAIALAVAQAFPGLEVVRVSPHAVVARRGEARWSWTHDATGFVVLFDGGRPVAPRVVTLTPRTD